MKLLLLVGGVSVLLGGCADIERSERESHYAEVARMREQTGALCLAKDGVPIFDFWGRLANCVLACREVTK